MRGILKPPLAQVYRCNFWMCFFGSKSPKRTALWSNSKLIKKFWLGKLSKQVREKLQKEHPTFKTVVKYVDKDGKRRFHGSKQLRSTQKLVYIYNVFPCGSTPNMYICSCAYIGI